MNTKLQVACMQWSVIASLRNIHGAEIMHKICISQEYKIVIVNKIGIDLVNISEICISQEYTIGI